MPTYRPVSCRFWNDADIERLSSEAKLVFLYLFTNDSTTESGIYSMTPKRVFERTGIPLKKCESILKTELQGKITYDESQGIVFVHSFLKCNGRGAPNLVQASIIKNAMDYQSRVCWDAFVLLYAELHYINEINDLIKYYQSLSKVFPKTSLDIEVDISNRKEEDNTKIKDTIPPDIAAVKAYCAERKNHIDTQKWYDFYESKGWMIGKNRMKDWKASIRLWEKEGRNGIPVAPLESPNAYHKNPDGSIRPVI
jgi:hypothetical protein